MEELLLVIILIFVGQTLGSLIGLIRRPSKKAIYASLAFAAAMMIGLSIFELIPESLAIAPWWLVAASFLGGAVIFFFIDHLLPHVHPELLKKEHGCMRRTVNMLVVGIGLHNIPEGLAIGMGFALDPSMGILIALAIAAQDIPENIATIVPLYCLHECRKKAFFIVMVTVMLELVGFLVGYFILKGASMALLGASLAMAAGLMVYISLDELLPSAKLGRYPKQGVASILLGLATVGFIILLSSI